MVDRVSAARATPRAALRGGARLVVRRALSQLVRSEAAPVAAIAGMSAVIAAQPLDADLWVHLNTGRFIAQTGRLPYPDPFTFSAGDALWTAHEWLPALAIYHLVETFGVGVAGLAMGLVIAATWLVVERSLAGHGVRPLNRALAIVAAALPLVPFGGIRPLHVGVLAAVIVGALLLRHRRTGSRVIWLAPPAFLVWANVHGSFPIGIGMFGALALDAIWQRRRPAAWRGPVGTDLRAVAGSGALSVAALLLNPSGPRLLAQPVWQLGQPLNAFNSDWQPPTLGSPTWWLFVTFIVLAALALMAGRRRVEPALLAAAVVLLWMGFSSRKLMVFAAVLTPLLLAGPIGNIAMPDTRRAGQIAAATGLVAAAVAVGVALAIAPRTLGGPFTVPMPTEATRTLAELHPQRVLNTYHWGAYLTWSLAPATLVYIDGRLDPFAARALPNYLRLIGLEEGWEDALADIHPDAVVMQTGQPLVRRLAADPDWRIVHQDSVATVLVPKVDRA